MTEILTDPGYVPFAIAGAVTLGLLLIEVVLLSLGLASLDIDGAEIDADFDAGVDLPPEVAAAYGPDIEAEFGDAGAAAGDLQPAQVEAGAMGTILDLVGLRRLPLVMSLALLLASFAAVGIAVQSVVSGLFGGPLPAGLAAALVAVPAIVLNRGLTGIVRAILPRDESAAVSARHLGRRPGVVTVGTARRGHPAEVRVKDRYGNTHYLRVEPLRDDEEFPQGSDVFVMRLPGGLYRLLRL